ncbi:uncharacterized protein LOC134249366, partial [Saccostrea cucullata]|uniref:uncharacterized protein LOC134249366 n=1 Tax=Saccostrea cuccullata TaxID=36930 RepID=UPI002ED4FFF2
MYACESCGFKSTKESNYIRHLSTGKHIKTSLFLKEDRDVEPPDGNSFSDDEHQDIRQEHGDDSSDGEDTQDGDHGDKESGLKEQSQDDNPFFPFNNKLHMLLYVLKNSPTHSVSNEVVKFVIYILKEAGVKEIPTMHDLEETRFGDLNWRNLVQENEANDGTTFWSLKPSEILKLFLANPKYAKDVIRLPTNQNNHPSGAEKWRKDITFHHLRIDDVSLFTGKMYTYRDNNTGEEQHGMLKSFIDEKDVIKGVIQPYVINRENNASPQRDVNDIRPSEETIEVDVKHLRECTEQAFCQHENLSPFVESLSPVWTLPVNIFIDDTSANRSKRWLGLHCIQMQPTVHLHNRTLSKNDRLAVYLNLSLLSFKIGLKLPLRQQHDTISLLCASEKVEPMTLMKPVISDIQSCKRDGISGFDAYRKEECIITTDLNIIVADFNMQSYLCNHLGACATKYCPRCYADVDHATSKARERTPSKTLTTINRINMRSMEADKRKLRQQTGVKEYENPLWDIINPHRDIPVGFLHLMPLGLTKHLVKCLTASLSDEKVEKLQAHLSSLTKLSFANKFFASLDSRQGKDFKQYLQFAPINFAYVGIPRQFLKMLNTLAQIQQVLQKDQFTESDIEEAEHLISKYLNQVETHIPDLKRKAKTHLLCHMVDDIKRHGPPKGFTEDGFEKNHASIRNDIFHQNQKQRSRDTAISFSHMTLLNHIISGGYFPQNNDWVCSGHGAKDLGLQREVLQYMGRSLPEEEGAVVVRKLNRKPNGKALPTLLEESTLLQLCTDLDVPYIPPEEACIYIGSAIKTQRNELANVGDALKYYSAESESMVGIFKEALVVKKKRSAEIIYAVKIQILEKVGRSQETGCPLLQLKDRHIYKHPCKIIQLEEVFHNCKDTKCPVQKDNISNT